MIDMNGKVVLVTGAAGGIGAATVAKVGELGGAIFILSTIRWIRDVRRDIADLPLDHDHH